MKINTPYNSDGFLQPQKPFMFSNNMIIQPDGKLISQVDTEDPKSLPEYYIFLAKEVGGRVIEHTSEKVVLMITIPNSCLGKIQWGTNRPDDFFTVSLSQSHNHVHHDHTRKSGLTNIEVVFKPEESLINHIQEWIEFASDQTWKENCRLCSQAKTYNPKQFKTRRQYR